MNRIKLAVAGAVVAVFCGYTQPGWAQTQIALGRAKPLNETSAFNGGYLFNAPSQYEDRANDADFARLAASGDAFKSSAYQNVPKAEPMKPLANAYHAQMCRFEEPVDAPALPDDMSDASLQNVDELVDATSDVVLELDDPVVQPAPATSNSATIAPLNEASGAPTASSAPSDGNVVVYQPAANPAATNAKKLPYPTKPENRVERTRPINSPWTIPQEKTNNNGGMIASAGMGGQFYGNMAQPPRAWNRPLYGAFTGAMTGDYATGYCPELAAQAANARPNAQCYEASCSTFSCANPQVETCDQEYAFCENVCYGESRVMTGIVGEVEYLGWQSELSEGSSFSANGSGLRARLGYRCDSGWDLIWNYTYFAGDRTRSVHAPVVVPGATPLTPAVEDATISASNAVHLNAYSLELGRWNWLYDSGLRPFIGFQWSQLKETASSSKSVEAASAEGAARSELNSYGVRFGAEWKRDLCCGFQAFARAAGVVGVGEIGVVGEESLNGQDVAARKVYSTDGAGAVEAALGLAWRCGNFQIQGGYEFNDWFNAAKVGGKNSDFLAYGWFAGLSWNR